MVCDILYADIEFYSSVEKMLKIVSISDTHTKHGAIVMPPGDVLVHAGDITNKGSIKDLTSFTTWLKLQSYKHKVVIAGNHDFCFANANQVIARTLIEEAGAVYLQDSEVTIDGVKFWGSPWQPFFYDWAFNLHRGKPIAEKWALIPEDTNVLITHGPPKNVLDIVESDWGHREHVGCEDLLHRLISLPKLKAHIFGHLHLGYGVTGDKNGIQFVNASTCTERYEPLNKPIVIEI